MIRYFTAHPTAANLLMLGILIIGLASVPRIKRETFPEIPPDKVEARVTYPGASAAEVEEAVCRRIEDAVDGVNHVEEMLCESRENIGIATITMVEGRDYDRFLNDVKTGIEAIDNFPAEVEIPVIQELDRTDLVIAVAITGPMSPPDLKAYAEMIKDRMILEEKVSQVTVKGFSDHQIRVEIPAATLQKFGLSVSGIADAIASQSVDLPAGAIETGAQDILIRFADERRSPDEFRDLIVVAAASGAEIRLGDIATISDRFERDEDKIIFNGLRAALLEVTKTKSEDTLTVMEAVSSFLDRERLRAPPGVGFTLTKNVSSIVRDRLDMLLRNGSQGLLLVFLTMWLFFSFRFSFWVAMGLPVSFLGTIFVMSLIGYSFNMLTMVGLLIAIGLLMDDAIVLAENIATHLTRGKSPLDAAVDGTREVAPGVLSSFATTICIFGSLAFLEGDIGAILKVMPIVLISTLAVSLFEAFLILPHHISHSVRSGKGGGVSGFRRRFDAGLERVRENVLGRFVDCAVEWRYLTLGLAVGIFLLSISLITGGALKFRTFPDIDGDVVEARVLLPQGTPLARTEAVVGRITSALEEVNAEFSPRQPQGRSLVRNVSVQFNTNVDAHEEGPHVATVTVDLLGSEERNARLDDVLNLWRERVGQMADVLNLKFTELQIGPGGLAIDIRLLGDDLEALKRASLELQARLKDYRGVFDLADDLRPGKPEIRLRLREGASALGLNAAGIASQLRSAFYGKTAGEIQVGAEAYEIDVRLSGFDRNSLADLENFHVTTAAGEQVPLGAVASLDPGRGFARIARIDSQRAVTIQGDVDGVLANAGEIIEDVKRRFVDGEGLLRGHPSVRVAFEGQAKEGRKTGESIRRGFLLGLIGVFLLLSFQFRSYVEPIIVMVAIPLGLIGMILGHVVMGLEISMPSMVGFASLAGVVVNDSILLVTFVKLRRAEGRSVAKAACQASRERFRAVLLTSLTTIMGILPLLTERSLQAQVLTPLVTSLAFGLLASTILVLIVVPALYTILDDFGLTTVSQREGRSTDGNAPPDRAPAAP